jgi:hypothetical protein
MEPYSVVGEEGRSVWRKSLVKQAWDLFGAAVDLVRPEHSNIRLAQYIPTKDMLRRGADALEYGRTEKALEYFEEAIAASVDAVQVEQIKNLVKRIKGE